MLKARGSAYLLSFLVETYNVESSEFHFAVTYLVIFTIRGETLYCLAGLHVPHDPQLQIVPLGGAGAGAKKGAGAGAGKKDAEADAGGFDDVDDDEDVSELVSVFSCYIALISAK